MNGFGPLSLSKGHFSSVDKLFLTEAVFQFVVQWSPSNIKATLFAKKLCGHIREVAFGEREKKMHA